MSLPESLLAQSNFFYQFLIYFNFFYFFFIFLCTECYIFTHQCYEDPGMFPVLLPIARRLVPSRFPLVTVYPRLHLVSHPHAALALAAESEMQPLLRPVDAELLDVRDADTVTAVVEISNDDGRVIHNPVTDGVARLPRFAEIHYFHAIRQYYIGETDGDDDQEPRFGIHFASAQNKTFNTTDQHAASTLIFIVPIIDL